MPSTRLQSPCVAVTTTLTRCACGRFMAAIDSHGSCQRCRTQCGLPFCDKARPCECCRDWDDKAWEQHNKLVMSQEGRFRKRGGTLLYFDKNVLRMLAEPLPRARKASAYLPVGAAPLDSIDAAHIAVRHSGTALNQTQSIKVLKVDGRRRGRRGGAASWTQLGFIATLLFSMVLLLTMYI